MPSMKYKMIDNSLKVVPLRQMLNREGKKMDRLVHFFEKFQQGHIPEKLLRNKVDYRVMRVGDRPCVVARKMDQKPDRALLLLFGGGFFMPSDNGDYRNIIRIVEETNTEVWFPLYPQAPEYKMTQTVESVLDVYFEMLKHFPSGKITFLGSSSGASLCMYMCIVIKEQGLKMPYPDHMILLSPGMCLPPTEDQMEKMKQLEKKDHLIPIRFCTEISDVVGDEKSRPLFNTFEHDWSGFPSMDIYFGTHEIFHAYMEDCIETAEKYQVFVEMHEGEGMMHCWPMFDTREAAQTWSEILELIRQT